VVMERDSVNYVLLYDGVCGFCDKTVQIILSHDKHGTMRFAALQSNYGQAILAKYASLQNVDSLILQETSLKTGEERVFMRSTAALRIAAYLGGMWKLCLITYLLPASVRDWIYDLFARHRYRLFGKYESCAIPSKEVRERFIDAAEVPH